MDCHEARRLLDRGVIPGSASPERATLGFHVVGCPTCRAHRAAVQERLLADLLAHEPRPLAPTPKVAAPPQGWSRLGASLSQMLWYAAVGAIVAIGLGVVIVLGQAGLSLYHIRQNVQAMQIPTPPLVVDLPTAAPPAGMLHPSPTPAIGASSTPIHAAAAPGATPTQARPSATTRPAATRAPPATPTPQAPPAGEPMTVLLLGSDRRPGEEGPSRTDAVIIVRIDPIRHRVALLSLPRDLMVEIPGYGQTRINAANVWGEIYGAPGGGVALARETVGNLLGIPIDYSIYIDFEGFIGAIDALGGVTVDVQKELYDPEFPTMDYGYTVAHFLPGPQRLDGATALMYSRIRHPDSDFARMRRQQQVLAGVVGAVRDQNALESLKRLEDLTTALRGYVKTDIPEDRLLGLAWALRDISSEQIERYLVDENMVSFGAGDDRWAEFVQPASITGLVRELMGEAP
jgi:LCP family protein required for cell wall assembly